MSIYLSKPGILESKIAKGVVDKDSTISCKESGKVLIIRDLKTVYEGRGRFNLLDFFYRDKANIRTQQIHNSRVGFSFIFQSILKTARRRVHDCSEAITLGAPKVVLRLVYL